MITSGKHIWVLSRVPGRIRLHLPYWEGTDLERLKNRLLQINGVQSVQVNPLTENLLVHFDHREVDEDAVLERFNELLEAMPIDYRPAPVGQSNLNQATDDGNSRVRIMVRGLLGHAVVDSLWFGAGFLGSAVGLPLGGLGPLHVLLDIAVWSLALTGELDRPSSPREHSGQTRPPAGQYAYRV